MSSENSLEGRAGLCRPGPSASAGRRAAHGRCRRAQKAFGLWAAALMLVLPCCGCTLLLGLLDATGWLFFSTREQAKAWGAGRALLGSSHAAFWCRLAPAACSGGYTASSSAVRTFWRVVEGMPQVSAAA